MGLEVIGVGFGRTGTTALELALDRLGYGPCYNEEALLRDAEFWRDVVAGAPVDWESGFERWRSLADWHGALVWERLAEQFPEARFVLTVRDPDTWHRSMVDTFEPLLAAGCNADEPERRAAFEIWYGLIMDDLFDGCLHDRDAAVRVFDAHNRAVQDGIGADRLLVVDLAAGWDPLCEFLDVPVPDEPFPRTNSRADLIAAIAREL